MNEKVEAAMKSTLSVASIIIFLTVACKLSSITSKTTPTSEFSTLTPTSLNETCGIGVFNNSARAWVEGVQARQVCEALVVVIRSEGEQPVNWSGVLSLDEAYVYSPACSDELEDFSYEIVGKEDDLWASYICQWVVENFGISGLVTTPDFFGIITSAREEANKNAYATEQAWQAEEEAYQATQEAWEESRQATEEAKRQNYKTACLEHGGYLSEAGNCIVDYPGWPAQPVALHDDGTWDADRAEIERGNCETLIQDAYSAEQIGHPWSIPPEYHPDTGVCAGGQP